jgi:tetratricopeptide (TPR) repeat protein
MTIKKKAPVKTPGGGRPLRASNGPAPRSRPEHSAAFESLLRDYEVALDLLRRRDYVQALGRFEAVERGAIDEPELAERSRTWAGLCRRRTAAPPPAPTSAEDLYLAGVVKANAGRPDEALPLLDAALRAEPGSPRVLYARAAAWALQGNVAAAVAELRQAVAADPTVRFQAMTDADFDRVRDDAQFIDIIEPTPAGA